jgi:penicillin-binding protein 1A
MFQSPNGYNPYVYPEDANERKNTVLYLMKRHGYITDEQYQAGIKVNIADLLDVGTTSVNEYQGFIDTVVQEIIDDTGNNPYELPMDIQTTMVTKKQDAINKFYKTHKFKDKKVEVGVGVIDGVVAVTVAVTVGLLSSFS